MVTQGKGNKVEFALEFGTLAAGGRWNESALKAAIRQGLNQKVLTELTCQEDKMFDDSLIDLAICLDHLICNHKVQKGVVSPMPEANRLVPMQMGQTRLCPGDHEK